jgi:hypothetical protein
MPRAAVAALAEAFAPKRGAASAVGLSFRAFLESPDYCGLELSPAMGAIVDASEGVRPRIDDALATRLFGCELDALPTTARRVIAVRAGGQAGKTSRLLAPKAVHAAWTVPLPNVRRGQIARALITAPDRDLATAALNYARGYIAGSPTLRAAVVESGNRRSSDDDEEDVGTQERIVLRRPHDGKLVEIVVKAATSRGKGGRSRTLVFAGLDEACFFQSDATYAVTDEEVFRAVIMRVVPGGQVWAVSTPWLADEGFIEGAIAENWGTHEEALVAVAGTRLLFPGWDPDGVIERNLRKDPDNAARELDAVPMRAGSADLFDREAIAAACAMARPDEVPSSFGAGGDFAFDADSSASAGAARWGHGPKAILGAIYLEEERPEPGQPLRPSTVVHGFAARLQEHGIGSMMADAHYRRSVEEHLEAAGLELVDAPGGEAGKFDTYAALRRFMNEGRLALGSLPESMLERLKTQLQQVKKRPKPGGGYQIYSPRRKGPGGGHGDLVSALVLAVWQASQSAGDLSVGAAGARRWTGEATGRGGRGRLATARRW